MIAKNSSSDTFVGFNGSPIFSNLISLSENSSEEEKLMLIEKYERIGGQGNAEQLAIFYLPITLHILFYCSEYAERILKPLISLLFCLGFDDTDEVIESIPNIIDYHLKTNSSLMTEEGKMTAKTQLQNYKTTINKIINELKEEIKKI